MIKNKNNIIELLNAMRNFTYIKDSTEIAVVFRGKSDINFLYNTPSCFITKSLDYDKGVSVLYQDRKYINKVLF